MVIIYGALNLICKFFNDYLNLFRQRNFRKLGRPIILSIYLSGEYGALFFLPSAVTVIPWPGMNSKLIKITDIVFYVK